jgi:predicted enzyme related to lactoylglutathione lyase
MTDLTITGVDFVMLPTDDIEASKKFYGETLNLPLLKQWGKMPGVEYQAGNLTIAIIEPKAFGMEFAVQPFPIALQVDDVPKAKEHLEAEGVTFNTDIIDSGECHQAYFSDPAGNALGIHHRYAPVE